jgi:hypothetical protein
MRVNRASLAVALFGAFACAAASASGAVGAESAALPFAAVECPRALDGKAACHAARDERGAWVVVAMPTQWNRRLVVHAHGGPRLSEPTADESLGDLERFAMMVRDGYAWVGSTYRAPGYGVRRAAEDVDRSRVAFWERWGRPERTFLHGQSWGGNVAAKLAELGALGADGTTHYDGIMTTNAVLSGGTRAYGFRADLRAIYQYFCRNHPAPDDVAYPLWQGLPKGASMSREALVLRVDDCTGVDRPPRQRSPEQAARLRQILAVSGVAEAQLTSHLAWGTFHFQDLVHRHLDGGNPFDNAAKQYRGSDDDAALNAGIERFTADRRALDRLGWDADLTGLILVPHVAVHGRLDPVVGYRALETYAATVGAAGRGHLFFGWVTEESDHSQPSEATYLSALATLEVWLDTGARPTGPLRR